MTTLLIAEHDNASIKDATHKALTAAAALGGDVHVLVAGENAKAAADGAAKLAGVKKVLLADNAAYAHDLAEPLAALIVSLAGSYDASNFHLGSDNHGGTAVRFGTSTMA